MVESNKNNHIYIDTENTVKNEYKDWLNYDYKFGMRMEKRIVKQSLDILKKEEERFEELEKEYFIKKNSQKFDQLMKKIGELEQMISRFFTYFFKKSIFSFFV